MKRILIANRGEIARRVIRTAHAMGIETVAVFSDADADALHVREAGFSHALGGNTSAESYLRIDKLLAAAAATGADAVHPGYGFLSENAGFAEAVQTAGLVWIGPPPAAIRALGSKAQVKVLARQSAVPCLPGYDGADQDDALLEREAARIGYPVMIKAVAGGGGRGMRLVAHPGDFMQALHSARSEAQAGFGDARVLIERALLAPRHVEVQVFADQHGGCIHLGERDCSVQRRHQKIIEESPSPAVDADMRARMGRCAVDLARSAGYVGAGTVEFLVDGGDFFLMEMNTRLQVEHPVTEALTGQDLVAWQIRVARGEKLPWTQEQVSLRGHAIEVRLCAEDEQFAPRTGRVRDVSLPSAAAFAVPPFDGVGTTLRIDSAIQRGATVTPYYDSMLGKLIVHAPSRDMAIAALRAALRNTRVLGVHTNRAFLAACLDHPVFRRGEALVPFLNGAAEDLRGQLRAREDEALWPAIAAITLQGDTQGAGANALQYAFARPVRVRHRETTLDVGLRIDRTGTAHLDRATAPQAACALRPVPGAATLMTPAASGAVRVLRCEDDAGSLATVHAVPLQSGQDAQWHVQTDAGAELWLDDLSLMPARQGGAGGLKTELRAPFNGRVIRLGAEAGARLEAGALAVVIESMKLEHTLNAPAAVRLAEVLVAEGQQVSPGQLLMRFAPVDEAAEAAA
jgi:3-methylcrotonyl-CoA carboxylase alpha subunit/geranyl-CoA carboxylase alpha subunit